MWVQTILILCGIFSWMTFQANFSTFRSFVMIKSPVYLLSAQFCSQKIRFINKKVQASLNQSFNFMSNLKLHPFLTLSWNLCFAYTFTLFFLLPLSLGCVWISSSMQGWGEFGESRRVGEITREELKVFYMPNAIRGRAPGADSLMLEHLWVFWRVYLWTSRSSFSDCLLKSILPTSRKVSLLWQVVLLSRSFWDGPG